MGVASKGKNAWGVTDEVVATGEAKGAAQDHAELRSEAILAFGEVGTARRTANQSEIEPRGEIHDSASHQQLGRSARRDAVARVGGHLAGKSRGQRERRDGLHVEQERRHIRRGARGGFSLRIGAIQPVLQAEQGVDPVLIGCLFYTSDAADE